ncbi:hypothetical protein LSTR_LSTR001695 [Laodelphax striatellus]|uniref:Uncharacterized protein n=1 Tax=Laodelphax striatellus TaxID=195883 RepID=A0A482XC72_LAOST|nr:hypothetical protein LSTR_LSTR001695 [Laodelphax striatellus]
MPSNQFPFLDAFLGQLEERAKARQYTPFRSLKTHHWGRSLVDLRGPLTRLSTPGLWAVPMVFRSEVAVAVVDRAQAVIHIFDPMRAVTTSQLDLVKSTIRKFAQLKKVRYTANFNFKRYPIFESDLPRWKAGRIIAVQLYDFFRRLPITTVYCFEDDIWRLHQAFPALRSYLRDGSERVEHANDDALLDPGLVDGGATRHQPMSVEAVPSEEEDLLLEEGGGGFSFIYGKEEPTDDIAQLSIEDALCTAAAACIAEPHDGSTPPPTRPGWVEARGLSARWDALKHGPKDVGVLPLEEGAMDAAEEPAATSFYEALEAVKEQLAESANDAVEAAADPAAASTKEADAVVVMPSDPQRPGAGTSTGRPGRVCNINRPSPCEATCPPKIQ